MTVATVRPISEASVSGLGKGGGSGLAYWEHLDEAVTQPSTSGQVDSDALISSGSYAGTFGMATSPLAAMESSATASVTVWVNTWLASGANVTIDILDASGNVLHSEVKAVSSSYSWSSVTKSGLTGAQALGHRVRISGSASSHYYYVLYSDVNYTNPVASADNPMMMII